LFRNRKACAITGLGLLLICVAANGQESLIDQLLKGGRQTIKDSDGFFQVSIPREFKCQKLPSKLLCQGTLRSYATFSIVVQDIVKTATAPLVAYVEFEKYEKQQKEGTITHLKIVKKGKTSIDDMDGLMQIISYDQLGNIQLPRLIQDQFFVTNGKQITIQTVCGSLNCAGYRQALQTMQRSLRLAGIEKSGKPLPIKDDNGRGTNGTSMQDQLEETVKQLGL